MEQELGNTKADGKDISQATIARVVTRTDRHLNWNLAVGAEVD